MSRLEKLVCPSGREEGTEPLVLIGAVKGERRPMDKKEKKN